MRNFSQMAGYREVVSTERYYTVPYYLSKKGGIFDLWWPWKVNFISRNVKCGISRKRYEIKSSYQQNIIIKSHMYFQKMWNIWPSLTLKGSKKVTNRNLSSGISRKRYEIESSYQQDTTTKLHIGFPKNVKYLTFGDSERSRSITEIIDAEYLANGTREFVSTGDLDKVAHWLLKKSKIFDLWWLWKVKVTNRNRRCGISRKRYMIESLYQQNIIIQSHIGFPKKVKYLTFGDPERSRNPRCGISRKRYEIEFVSTERHHYKVSYGLSEKVEIFDFGWPWKVKVTNRYLRCGISRNGTW